MTYTLGQAAKAVGMSKGTIAFAIKKGRISGHKDGLGQWSIDPAELHRVYPPCTGAEKDKLYDAAPIAQSSAQAELEALRVKNNDLEKALKAQGDLLSQIEGERDRLYEQNTRITALLAAPKADPYAAILERLEAIEKEVVSSSAPTNEPPPKSFWRRLVG